MDSEDIYYQRAKDYGTLESIEEYLTKYPNGKYVNELLLYKDKIRFFEKLLNKFVDIDSKLAKYNFIFLVLFLFIESFLLTFYYKPSEINDNDTGLFIFSLLIGLLMITVILKKIIKAIIKNLFKSFSDILYLYYLKDIKSIFGFISLDFIKNFNMKINRLSIKIFLYDMISYLLSLLIITLFLIINQEYIEKTANFILLIFLLILYLLLS